MTSLPWVDDIFKNDENEATVKYVECFHFKLRRNEKVLYLSVFKNTMFCRKPFVHFWDLCFLPSGDVGSFDSWGCLILGCIDVRFQYSFLTSWSLKFRKRTFLIFWRGFMQGFVVLPWLHFLLSLVDDRIAAFAAAMVWVCLAVSKVVSSFSALMWWLSVH